MPQKGAKLPDNAVRGGAIYLDGAIYSDKNKFIWKYADIVREDSETKLYKREEKDQIIYIID